jgi:hypothetical protein
MIYDRTQNFVFNYIYKLPAVTKAVGFEQPGNQDALG